MDRVETLEFRGVVQVLVRGDERVAATVLGRRDLKGIGSEQEPPLEDRPRGLEEAAFHGGNLERAEPAQGGRLPMQPALRPGERLESPRLPSLLLEGASGLPAVPLREQKPRL